MSTVEIDNKRQDALKPKPDDSAAHTLTVFAQSLAYSAVEAPTRGVAQILDHALLTKLDDDVQSKFNNAGIHQTEAAAYGTTAWKAEQFGNALGMVLPMWLSRKLMVGKAEPALAETASIADKAMREAGLSARTGFFYGAALTPTDDKNSTGNILLDRAKQGFNTAVTFGAMGASATLTGEVLNRTAASLESITLHSALKTSLQSVLSSSITHGAISGVPGGFIQAQLGAMENRREFASLQDIKESIVGMTMVGGTMGSAGLFKETAPKATPKINLEIPSETTPAFPSSRFAVSDPPPSAVEITTPKHTFTTRDIDGTHHPFDIEFDPLKRRSSLYVINHRSLEVRPIEFTPEAALNPAKRGSFDNFEQWGVETRQVPVYVYRFPGLTTEIVVPKDYADKIDQLRDYKVAPSLKKYTHRIWPEEMAQMLKQLPQSEIVKSVELLDHRNPWDLKRTRDWKVAAQAIGEVPGPEHEFRALADAGARDGTIRFFDSATGHEDALQEYLNHEWAHLLEIEPVFRAFREAANAERDGFFARDYAKENNSENWAVHLGERFLNADGAAFAELPEKAPARTLVMAKAIRNMLEERKDNPSPRHHEFMNRVEAAEALATINLQKGILEDIGNGDVNALDQKLRFLRVATTEAQSPEFIATVLKPIETDLLPILKDDAFKYASSKSDFATYLATELKNNYSEDKMPLLVDAFKDIYHRLQPELFDALPHEGQRYLLHDLSANIEPQPFSMLEQLIYDQRPLQQEILDAIQTIQAHFTKEAMEFHRSNQLIPDWYHDWLKHSDQPEVRLAVMQNSGFPTSRSEYLYLIEDFDAAAKREMIVRDAMSYIYTHDRSATWKALLKEMPQDEQINLLRELAQKHSPAYGVLANKIQSMNATEFDAATTQIRREIISIMDKREKTPEFIFAHPRRLTNSESFLKAAKLLNPEQTIALIESGGFLNLGSSDMQDVVAAMQGKLDDNTLLKLREAIPPNAQAPLDIEALSAMALPQSWRIVNSAK
jgi:hypothetical protein